MVIKFKENLNGNDRSWICFFCKTKHPNTLCWCPECNIARKHSNNLYITLEKKNKKKLRKSKNKNVYIK